MSKESKENLIANLLEQIENELGFKDFILIGTVNSNDGLMLNMVTSWGLSNQDMISLLIEGIASINESADEDDSAYRH